MMATPQFKEIGPAPISATVARQQMRALLEKVDDGNRQQTIKTLSGLTPWYRDLLDEELIAAWRSDDRAKVTQVIGPLADPRVAAGIVEFSWRQQRQATFTPDYAPMLGDLMARYPDSATMFLDDLFRSTAMGQTPDLSQPEAEAVCRILLDMPDIRTWKKSALQILPHYRREVQVLLDKDLHGDDREKMYRATRWLADLGAANSASDAQRGTAAAPTPSGSNQAAHAGANSPVSPGRSSSAAHGITLTPLDPAEVDDSSRSLNSNSAALMELVNRSRGKVDIYWIDFQGNRVPQPQCMGLPAGATCTERTYLTHPFLVIVSGTGGTTARDTGTRLAGFQAVTPNGTLDPAKRDIAIISSPPPAGPQGKSPEPARTARAAEVNAPSVDMGQVRTMVNKTDGQRYVWIPPGSFTMGCSPGDSECAADEKPPREERIAQGFWLGQTEVTQAAYLRITGGNPSAHKGDQLPVESLTWNQAANYCKAIDARLPSEVEWEYAARAGSTWARYGNLDDVAWHSGNGGGATHPVATKQPNAFGLYDMLGNVWEYVADGYPGSSDKILRGGSLLVDIRNTRASSRMRRAPSDSANGRGFRCAGDGPGAESASKSGGTSSELTNPAGVAPPRGNTNAAPRTLHLLALYRFRSDGSDASGLSSPFSFSKTAFRDGSLYLKGVYENPTGNDVYPATARVPRLNYLHFTAALDFNAEIFNPKKSAILYGGTNYRWWGLDWQDGVLGLSLNNGMFRHTYEGAELSQGAWHNVICSVDLSAGAIRTVLDGRALPDVQLPQGFRLDVVGSEYEGRDKRFTFVNYSNGAVFQGHANNLRIYDDSLSGTELQALYRAIAKETPDPIRTVTPTLTAVREPMVNKQDGQRYVWIPPGAFTMGCSAGDSECNDNEKPSHPEEIADGFWLGETEVTQAAYLRITKSNPSYHKGDQLPVDNVTWNDANRYCGVIGGHLPTEAQWEYAVRGHAGITPARYGNLDAAAWYSGNSGGNNHPVAQKQPNAFGLYDMLGNVWEWVEDSDAGNSILRGGSSEVYRGDVRASLRSVVAPSASTPTTGFRCAGEWPVPEQTPPGGSAGTPLQATGSGGGPVNGVYRIGNGVSAPALLRKVEPQYSEEARQKKYQGSVLLYIQIDPSGKAINVRVLHSLGLGLDEKAMEAVKKWKFRPGYKDGQPVTVESQVEINFRLL